MFVCLAIPGKVVEIDKNKEHAFIDYGEGTKRKANISLVDVKVGEYVLVHAGFAIEVLNKKDANKCNEFLNFPHVRIGTRTNEININKNPPQTTPSFFEWFVNDYKWNHSCWDYRYIIQSNSHKVHLVIQFSRYRLDGSKIGSFPSLWIITNQDGHWGIKMRSSFAP